MTPSKRPDCPKFLEQHWKQWGIEYAEKRREDPSYSFHWKVWEKKPVNQILLAPLSQMTGDHCAYCDWFPTNCGTDQTIDHFKPKTKFPKESYAWENLYLACRQCQKKEDLSSDEEYALLLRPDERGYTFERFFIYSYRTGEIEPNPAASQDDRDRAELTIRVFKLNFGGCPAARKRMLSQFGRLDTASQNEFRKDQPFRFLLPFSESGSLSVNNC